MPVLANIAISAPSASQAHTAHQPALFAAQPTSHRQVSLPSTSDLPMPNLSQFQFDTTLHLFLSLPRHTSCPLPLSAPRTSTLRFDPITSRTTPSLTQSRLVSVSDHFRLHPLLVSQIKSIRPESPARIYCDWFASPSTQICRLTKNPADSAWSYVWTPSVFSWVCPPVSFTREACLKFIRDRTCGIFIFFNSEIGPHIEQLRQSASAIFNINRRTLSFLTPHTLPPPL